jgi:AcrR family transcriptional regulator
MSLFLMQREQTKQVIAETSIALFRQKGYVSVTIDEITKKVGIGKGTFYNYFLSKNEVLLYWFEVKFEAVDVDEIASEQRTIRENLYLMVQRFIQILNEENSLIVSFLKELMVKHSEFGLDGKFNFGAVLREIMLLSLDSEKNEPEALELKVQILNSALFLPLLNWFYQRNPVEGLDKKLFQIIDICLYGMQKASRG